MDYNFREIEKKWQKFWRGKNTFRTGEDFAKPKYYILDMFPYPSGSGLHVGHPLGYIASDILARFKRLKGYNVLHPMGYDAFGLPAEQYAIQTRQHPAVTTEKNIARYREQLDNIGFSFDWEREIRTCDSSYYKWTQWIFIQLFNAWYNKKTESAEKIETLIAEFEKNGNAAVSAACSITDVFTADDWKKMSSSGKKEMLLNYRLAYLSDAWVNWCPALGTVLANEEVKDGFSERGHHPVERKQMKQWSLRITAYADRLLKGLEKIDWPEAVKDQQSNWIGRSEGASVFFKIKNSEKSIEVFTTRPDTIFGVSFLALAPEHELIDEMVPENHLKSVREYAEAAKNRSERDRMADVKNISGVFSGAYAIHPFTKEELPVWVGDYVLAGYGTGAVMAVPAGDQRDYDFAKHFDLPVPPINEGVDISEKADDTYDALMINSGFINGMTGREAIKAVIKKAEENGIGKGKINYRLRDAIFSRQRYWGEPFPVFYKDGMPEMLDESQLPLQLPEIDEYLPTETGEPPLARAKNWHTKENLPYETSTMPGWAGSSWYFLRYMDPNNPDEFASAEKTDYWKNVDLYIGGVEHATGHLLYVRFWTKFLFDMGFVPLDEPAQKLINQGMILGRSVIIWQGFYQQGENSEDTIIRFASYNAVPEETEVKGKRYQLIGKLHYRVPVEFADSKDRLSDENFKKLKEYYNIFGDVDLDNSVLWEIDSSTGTRFILLSYEVEKMSKSKHNTVNPDDIVEKYGADTFRLYEMFLGPLEQYKPWNTHGIEGVAKFIRKLWKLYHNGKNEFFVTDESATKEELKALHKIIKKVEDDMERFSFNTSISNFMICVNTLTDLKCRKREILSPLAILISPYAPHIAEELWSKLGNTESIGFEVFPQWNEEYLKENSFEYPVSVNGKTRCKITLPLDFTKEEIIREVVSSDEVKKFLGGNDPKKVIVVPGRIVNIVV